MALATLTRHATGDFSALRRRGIFGSPKKATKVNAYSSSPSSPPPPPLPTQPPFPITSSSSSIMEWDLVLFPLADQAAGPGRWSVGKVEEIRLDERECVCQPLYQEEGTGVWLESHERDLTAVRLSEIRAVLQHDFAQRMSPDRVSNPHGMGAA